MGKARRGYKEYSREQRLISENKKIKVENARLRKQMARIDLDRHEYIKDVIETHYQREEEQAGADIVEKLKKEWSCNSCGSGHLEIFIYNRHDGTWYYRRCSNCPHRTKSQKYNPGKVRGIIKDTKKED